MDPNQNPLPTQPPQPVQPAQSLQPEQPVQPVQTTPPMQPGQPGQQAQNASTIKQRVGEYFNMSGTASKKEFLHGFMVFIASAGAAIIAAIIFFVIAGSISGIEVKKSELAAERPDYVFRSDYTGKLDRPSSSDFKTYKEYTTALKAYNEDYDKAIKEYEAADAKREESLKTYQEDYKKATEAYKVKTNIRDGFASIFSSLGSIITIGTLVLASASMWALLVRRLRDAGVSTKSTVLILLAPIAISELAFIASQFIAPDAVPSAIANILVLDIQGYFKALQPLILINLLSILLGGAITVATLFICFTKNTSEVKNRSILAALKG